MRPLILVGWTIAACVTLTEAIRFCLLGQPDMQIEGNGLYASHLVWYQDRIDNVDGQVGLLPRPWVLSVSMRRKKKKKKKKFSPSLSSPRADAGLGAVARRVAGPVAAVGVGQLSARAACGAI